MAFRISTRGFKEAADRCRELGDVPESREFRQVLVRALEPVRDRAVANVHSITGRTAAAIVVGSGKGIAPSAWVKVDKRVATALWNGRSISYPTMVEAGHGGKHPAPPHPFFRPAFDSAKAQTRQIVRDGIEDLIHPYQQTPTIGGEFS